MAYGSYFFDEQYYLQQKLAQLQATGYTGYTTTAQVAAAIAAAGMTVQQHFQLYGDKEGIAPNAFFDDNYYLQQKATQAGMTVAQVRAAITSAGLGIYQHYMLYGFAETYNGAYLNPSASFDDNAYLAAKATQCGMTVAQVVAAFQAAGLTPIEHWYRYGQYENLSYNPTVVGTTYTLTTGADTIPGTGGNDTIVAGESAGAKTLTAGDNINGAGGTNVINVAATSAHTYAGFTMQNVQTLNVTADGGLQTFDLSGTTGLQTIVSNNSSTSLEVDQVTSLANVTLNNLTAAAGGVAPDVTVAYQDAVVSGTADAVTLTLNTVNAGTVTLGRISDADGGIETVNIVATGGASKLSTLDSKIAALNFSGSQNVTITNALNDTVKTINASGSTGGGLGVTIAATNPNAVTFTGGMGNDSITFALDGGGTFTSLTATDTITGGAGNDTLTADRTGLFAAGAAGKVTGVETITMSTQLTNAAVYKAGTWFSDASTFNLAAGYQAGATINVTTGTGTTAGQAVRIAGGANVGTLTIGDTATSATGDQASLGIYGASTADVAFSTGELETVNLTSGSTTATAASGVTETLNLSGGLKNVSTLNISGADNLTLSTTAATAITTVAAGSALGNLNLLGLTYAVPASSTATGVSITTGSGNDTVSGTIGKDTVVLGAGSDTVFGTLGADTFTLGSGNDVVVYTASTQSDSVGTDTITDFTSGSDKVNLQALGTSSFNGNFDTFAHAQGGLTGGGVSSAVFEQDNNTLWVDVDGNGTLDNNDLRVVLTNVSTLNAATDFIYGAINYVTLTGVGAVVNGTTSTKATGVTTAGPDVVSASAVFANGATSVDGLGGTNTLNITTQVAANTNLGAFTNFQTVNVQAGIAAANTLTMFNGAATINVTADGDAANTVILGTGAQVLNGSADAEVVTLGDTGQSVYGLGGNDTVKGTVGRISGATALNGGSGINTLQLVGTVAGATLTIGNNVSNFQTLNLVTGLAETVTLGGVNSFNTLIFGDAGDAVNATTAQAASITNITGATVGTLNITSGTSEDMTGITFASALSATNLTTGNDTIVVNGSAAATGAITSFGTLSGGTGTDNLVLATAVGAVTDLDGTRGFETVTLSGGAQAITLGNDNIVAAGTTMTVDGTALTGALTFVGTNETDGHLTINTAAIANNSVTGGSLADTFNLSTTAVTKDTIVITGTTSTALNLDKVDTISGFQAGTDKIDVTNAGAGKATYSITLANTAVPTFVGDVNSALTASGITLAAGDAVLISITGGTYAGTYALSSTAAGGITAAAELVKVTGTVGNITASDFI